MGTEKRLAMPGKKRDVQVHAAITICPTMRSEIVIGEKENEIAQFAVQLDARYAPFTRNQVKLAFEGLAHHCIDKMRTAGLLKAGQ